MSLNASDYLLAVQAPAYRLPGNRFATESAFAQHLIELRHSIATRIPRVVLFAPEMSTSTYERSRNSLMEIGEESHGIAFVAAFPQSAGRFEFWTRCLLPMIRALRPIVQRAAIVHSGLSDDLWRPMMAIVNYTAKRYRRPVVFVVDIDFRKDSHRYWQMGQWSFKSYVLNRLLYDPLKWMQVWLAVRHFQLVLLKSQSLVKDFGRGKPHVRNFFDVVHQAEHVIGDDQLRRRTARQQDPASPLQAAYFGRLVEYKGVALAIDAVHIARKRGVDVRFSVVGNGESESRLHEKVRSLDLSAYVDFRTTVPYGAALFDLMDNSDVTLATPIAEDTPRGAFDSMARGLPIVAFDINYYKDLAALGGGVVLADWPDPVAVADRICELAANRAELARLAEQGVAFALANTHSRWITLRSQWVLEYLPPSDNV